MVEVFTNRKSRREMVFIFLPFELSYVLSNISFLFVGSYLLSSLFMFGLKSSPEFRTISTLMIIGFLFLAAGHFLDDKFIKVLNIIPLWVPPLLTILGSFIAISPAFINLEFFEKKGNVLLLIFFGSIFIAILYGIYIMSNIQLPDLVSIVAWICIVIALYLLFRFSKFILSKNSEEKVQDYLKIFAKPQKLTEEEVSISKEKKTCLVCKNKILRDNYMCPDCNAFYCMKCKNVLMNSENACWVCYTPFDETKPVKVKKMDEEELQIEETPEVTHKDVKRKKKDEGKTR